MYNFEITNNQEEKSSSYRKNSDLFKDEKSSSYHRKNSDLFKDENSGSYRRKNGEIFKDEEVIKSIVCYIKLDWDHIPQTMTIISLLNNILYNAEIQNNIELIFTFLIIVLLYLL